MFTQVTQSAQPCYMPAGPQTHGKRTEVKELLLMADCELEQRGQSTTAPVGKKFD